MTKIINRKTKEITENKNPKGSYFLYNNFLGRITLKLVNKRFLSLLAGKHLNSRMSKKLIKNFIKNNNIEMSIYENKEYNSFNEFFSRKVNKNERKFSTSESDLCSPADSKVMVFGANSNLKFTVKNKDYSIESILRDKVLASEFKNGYVLVFRLGVEDYHRYSYIDSGNVLDSKKIKGIYHTVGPVAFDRFKVFEENVREYEVLDTKNFGKVVQIEVGAMFVGKIINYHRAKFTRGEEKGYFQFGGSTIVMLFKDKSITIDKDILENSENNLETKVILGEKIGKKYENI